ncbi:hypothetical protein TDB9533_02643 [Thalassocella blandensis]|nr:hypothetical protein TDB9533_02643 [Thalassocella blandensis]
MIKVFINDEVKTLRENLLLTQLLTEETIAPTSTFAIAINESFVPKTRYAETQLQDGDRIEILSPMQGG